MTLRCLSAGLEHVCFRAQLPGPHCGVSRPQLCALGQMITPSCGLHFLICKRDGDGTHVIGLL